MNQYQENALNNHCRLACETAQPKFGYGIRGGSIVLTVNSGYE